MLRSLAFAAAVATAVVATPSLAQGTMGSGPGCSGPGCSRGLNQAWPPEQRIPPGYHRPGPEEPPRWRPPSGGYYRWKPPRYEYYDYDRYDRVSCREAQRIVRRLGYRVIEALDCSGRSYEFYATRHGRAHVIYVSSRTGEILSIRRV